MVQVHNHSAAKAARAFIRGIVFASYAGLSLLAYLFFGAHWHFFLDVLPFYLILVALSELWMMDNL